MAVICSRHGVDWCPMCRDTVRARMTEQFLGGLVSWEQHKAQWLACGHRPCGVDWERSLPVLGLAEGIAPGYVPTARERLYVAESAVSLRWRRVLTLGLLRLQGSLAQWSARGPRAQ